MRSIFSQVIWAGYVIDGLYPPRVHSLTFSHLFLQCLIVTSMPPTLFDTILCICSQLTAEMEATDISNSDNHCQALTSSSDCKSVMGSYFSGKWHVILPVSQIFENILFPSCCEKIVKEIIN